MTVKIIYKYTFTGDGRLEVPGLVRVLLVDHQPKASGDNYFPTVWAEVDLHSLEMTKLVMVGTGWPVPENHEHVGSAVCGNFVWHVYEHVDPR